MRGWLTLTSCGRFHSNMPSMLLRMFSGVSDRGITATPRWMFHLSATCIRDAIVQKLPRVAWHAACPVCLDIVPVGHPQSLQVSQHSRSC